MTNTEDQVIIRHTLAWLSSTTEWSIELFATECLAPALAEAGIEVDKENPVDPNNGATYLRWRKTRGMQAGRIINGTTKFPLSWKWPWVNSLPEPFQSDCRRELLALAGVMNIPLMVVEVTEQQPARARLAELMREVADVLAAAAPADDGFYDQTDDPEAVDLLADEIRDVMTLLERELIAIATGTGRVGNLARLAQAAMGGDRRG